MSAPRHDLEAVAVAAAAGPVLEKPRKPEGPRHNLEAVAEALYGKRWHVELAADMGVSTREVRRWHKDPSMIMPHMRHRIRMVAERRLDLVGKAFKALGLGTALNAKTITRDFGTSASTWIAIKRNPHQASSVPTPEPVLNTVIVAATEDVSTVIEQEASHSCVSHIEDTTPVALATDVVQPPVRPRPRGRPGFVPPALRPVTVTEPQPSPASRTAPVAVRDLGISLSEIVGNDARDAQEAMRRLTYDDLRAGDRITVHYRQMLRTAHVLGRHESGVVLVSDQLSTGEWRSPRPLRREEFAEVTKRDAPTPDVPKELSPKALQAQAARSAWLATLGVDDVRIGDAIEITRDLHDGKGLRKYTAQVTYVKRGRLQITYRTKRGMMSHSIDPRRFVRIVSRPLSRGETISPTTAPETMGSEPSQRVLDFDIAPPPKHTVDPAIREQRLAEWRRITASVAIDRLIVGDTIFVEGPDQTAIKAIVTQSHAGVVYIKVSDGADGHLPERPLDTAEYMSLFDRVGLQAEIEAKFPEPEMDAA